MNTFVHRCTHCGELDKIPRAAAFFCSVCKAEPGEACVDMRTVATTRRAVGYLHPERQALLLTVDSPRPRVAPAARPAEFFAHICTHCEKTDAILRTAVFFCAKCKARPGEECVDARTFATTRRPAGYTHIVRQSLLDVADVLRLHPVSAS